MLQTATDNCKLQRNGGLAQLARAPALHAGGQRFDSVILHHHRCCYKSTQIVRQQWCTGIEKFFDILEEVKKEEQTTIETLFEGQKTKEQRSMT